MDTVLLAFDGSPGAERALRALCAQFRGRPNTRILALNVLCMPPAMALDDGWPEQDLARLSLCNRADEIGAEEGMPVFGQLGRARELADALVSVAWEDQVLCVVLPSAGRKSLWKRAFGDSVPRRLSQEAPCPVQLLSIPSAYVPALAHREQVEETAPAPVEPIWRQWFRVFRGTSLPTRSPNGEQPSAAS